MFDSWDDIDNMFAKLLGAMAEGLRDEWKRANELNVARDDVIWVPTTREGM